MPEIIACPDCGRKLRVPDTLVGKKVKCPDCNVKFTGGITTAPAGSARKSASPKRTDDDDADDRPSRRSRFRRDDDEDDRDDDRPSRGVGLSKQQKRSGWKMTLLGLNLLCYATYLIMAIMAIELLGCSLVMVIGASSMMSTDPNVSMGSMMGAGIAGLLLYGFLFLGYAIFLVVQVTGHGFCIAVPPKDGTIRKPMAIAAFCCICAMILLGLLGCGVTYGLRSQGGMVIGFVPLAISIGYHVCYFLFLKGVADAMREPAVGKQAVIFMITLPTVWVVSICMYFIMIFAFVGTMFGTVSSGNTDYMAGYGLFGMGCGILFVCVYIGLFVWYTIIIHQVRNAVKAYLE